VLYNDAIFALVIESTKLFFLSVRGQSYYGVEVESIADSVKRNAVRTMIRTTGQTPKQLFRAAHPLPSLADRRSLNDVVSLVVVVVGLEFTEKRLDCVVLISLFTFLQAGWCQRRC